MDVTTSFVGVATHFGMCMCVCPQGNINANRKISYLCGQSGQCKCPLRDGEDEDLDTDGDLDANTVVAAMEQAEPAGEPCGLEGEA